MWFESYSVNNVKFFS